MDRESKQGTIAGLAVSFRSDDAIITEYRGLTVAQLSTLRTSLAGNARYKVTKNTLARKAAAEAELNLAQILAGPTAIAFVTGDVTQAAKTLLDFAKGNPQLAIKGGVLDGRELTAAEVGKLADLEPRDVLLAKLAGAMKTQQSKAAATFAAPVAQMARLAQALRVKKEGE